LYHFTVPNPAAKEPEIPHHSSERKNRKSGRTKDCRCLNSSNGIILRIEGPKDTIFSISDPIRLCPFGRVWIPKRCLRLFRK
jgi:hypothetical protein